MRKAEEWNKFFEDNQRYADIINGIGCDGIQFVSNTDLTEVDTTEGRKSRDIIRKVAFGVNFAIIGIENQEKNDYELPLRTMYYDVSRYDKQAREIKKANHKIHREQNKKLKSSEYLYGFKKDDKLNPVITFVLYAGEEEWDAPQSLRDMIDFSDVPENLRTMVSDYKINVIPIRQFENTAVFKTDVKQVFDFIRCSKDKNKLLELVENDVYYRQVDDDAYDVITKYANAKELVKKEEYKSEGGKNNMCKAIQDLMNDSREEGREEERKDNVKNMLNENIAVEVICRIVNCDVEYVEKVQKEVS